MCTSDMDPVRGVKWDGDGNPIWIKCYWCNERWLKILEWDSETKSGRSEICDCPKKPDLVFPEKPADPHAPEIPQGKESK